MKLTKYEHACFTIEINEEMLVVDPGNLTNDLGTPQNVVAIVVSHEHADHFDVNALGALIANNPDAKIYAHESITRQLGDTLPHQTVHSGDKVVIEPYELEFYGGEHLKPFEDSPVVTNLGVMINDKVYYGGDSFDAPNKSIDVLLLPVSGSWMKASMARDYLYHVNPKQAIPTHDAISSNVGKKQIDKYWPEHAEKNGIKYQRLNEPLNIE